MKAWKTGVICAASYMAIKLALFAANLQHVVLQKFPVAPLLVITFAGVVYAILKYKDSGLFSVIEAFKEGARVALVTAVISAGFVYLYYEWIDPDYLEILSIKRLQEAQELLQGDELNNFKKATEFFNHAGTRALFTLSGMTIIGLLSSLIVALITRYTLIRK
ncbi:MAG: DUF4199 domain-containing protein [Flavobacteriales bacterium]|nr:DUF4199 domain-containing protein [Flavobacteriales bacterium]